MFPTQEVNINTVKANETSQNFNGKTFDFDFDSGEFILKDGKVVPLEQLEGLKIWISKALKTVKGRDEIYINKNYGISDLKELLNKGLPFNFVKAEIQTDIINTLTINTNVKSVENFVFERGADTKLKVTFDIKTDFGTVESGVNI